MGEKDKELLSKTLEEKNSLLLENKTVIETNQNELDRMTEKISTLSSNVEKLQGSLSIVEGEKETLMVSLSSCEKKYVDEAKSYQSKISSLELELDSANGTMKEMKENLILVKSEYEATLINEGNRVTDLESELESQKGRCVNIENQFERQGEELSVVLNDQQKSKEQIALLKQEIIEYQNSDAVHKLEMQEKFDNFIKEKETLNQNLEERNLLLSEQENVIKNNELKLVKNTEEIESLSTNVEKL